MPQLTVTTNELLTAGAGVAANTGVAFVVGLTDQGPPVGGPPYVACQSISQYTAAFGPRSAGSSALYDWLDEFFHDSNGGTAYVARVTDNTATKAALTLNDAGTEPTIAITALTAGTDGNAVYIVVVVGSGATFTATTSNSSTSLSAISSFAGIGPGTYVTGTGIPANTHIVSVNVGASTAVLSAAATASGTGVTITPSTFTVDVEDSAGDVLESHGPYYLTSQLIADTSSIYVTFAQSTGGGSTTNQPIALTSTALSGGADPNDITSSSYVTALAQFPAGLGPGSVAIPGQNGSTIWTGLLAHAQANNRFAILDMADSASVASITAATGTIPAAVNAGWGFFIQGSAVLPGITPGTTRTAAGSSVVAALRAQVGQTASQNQAPAGPGWPVTYPLGFTEYYGPTGSSSLPAGSFAAADVQTLEAAGVNVFANYAGIPCLFGFVTPVPKTTDAVFWQATAACERMALVHDCFEAAAPFLFSTIDGANTDTTALQTALLGVISNHYKAGALYGDNASDAGQVNVGAPVNTPQTAQAGQLNAALQVRISPYADTVAIQITTVPITQAVA